MFGGFGGPLSDIGTSPNQNHLRQVSDTHGILASNKIYQPDDQRIISEREFCETVEKDETVWKNCQFV